MSSSPKALPALLLALSIFLPFRAWADDSAAVVPLGFESGDWKGIELSTEHVKTGAKAALWKDHPANKSVSSDTIPHDWSRFEEMRLWIYHEGESPVPIMVVLTSRSDPKDFSYFSYRITVNWDGWKEVVLPLSYFEPSHDPAGLQKIDSVMFSADGWGLKPVADETLYLDGLSLRKASIRPASSAEQAELDKIKRQFCDFQRLSWKSSPGYADEEQKIRGWMKSLTPDGTWSDVDYSDLTRGYWRTMDHVNRVKRMSLAYTSPENPLHGDPALLAAIHSALGYWLKKDYRNPNWWHNEIGVPCELATVLLLMDAEVTPQERAAGIRINSRSVIDSPAHGGRGELTGQNRVWVAANALLRGLLTSDFDLTQKARNVIFEEVTIANQSEGGKPGGVRPPFQEGIQPDYSFFQHGPMLQLGNYGLAFSDDIVTWLTVLRSTALALAPDKIDIFRNYLLEGEGTVVWKGRMDINSCARQIGPQAPARKGAVVLRVLTTAKTADAAHADKYQAVIARDNEVATPEAIPARNKYFWRADYMVHRRPDYYVSTRMNSDRILPAELVNGENLQGGYSGDGATYLYLTGQEYEDLFPVWDWSRLPGVTSPSISDKEQLKPQNGKHTNVSDFVGGVSNGFYGAAVLSLNRDGLTARKSWFYFDQEVVCLGAEISSNQNLPITSSINQCLARGDVLMKTAQGKAVAPQPGVREYKDVQWAWHDNVGYVFPEPQTVALGVQKQGGKWNEISASGKNQSAIEADVFSAWIPHGRNPREAHYSYVILPGATAAEVETLAQHPQVTILSNTPAVQAVRQEKRNILQAVFYQPVTLDRGHGKTLSVDQPCIVMLDENKAELSIADPTQSLAEITVTQNGKPAKLTLPQGTLAGSTLSVPVSK